MTIDLSRRKVIAALGGAGVAWPLRAHAQQPTPMVGFLDSGSAAPFAQRVAWFRRGLNEAGFIEGQNVFIEFRWAEGHYDRLPELAVELVRRGVTVLAATGSPNSARAAEAATNRIPIVFANGGDPVRDGLVTSLNRPTGNATGICYYNSALVTKRLGVMRELLPAARQLGFVVNPKNPNAQPDADEIRAASQAIGLKVLVLSASTEQDFKGVFAAAAQQYVDGIIINNDAFFSTLPTAFADLASRYRIPTIYYLRDFTVAGGLLSYGTSIVDGYRRAGGYVGRILKGEKPTDLPVELSSKFELVINLKTAKALGLTIPPTLLAIADEVIE
jgi:putative tryptophan/tyrosine transport system substrate-binding protein